MESMPTLSVRRDSIRCGFPSTLPFPRQRILLFVAITHPKYSCPSVAPPSVTKLRERCIWSNSWSNNSLSWTCSSVMLMSCWTQEGSVSFYCSNVCTNGILVCFRFVAGAGVVNLCSSKPCSRSVIGLVSGGRMVFSRSLLYAMMYRCFMVFTSCLNHSPLALV